MILGQFRGEKLEAARGKRGRAVGHRVCARQPSRPGEGLGGCPRITVCQNLTFQNAPESTIGNLRGVWYKPGQYIVDIYAEIHRLRKTKNSSFSTDCNPLFFSIWPFLTTEMGCGNTADFFPHQSNGCIGQVCLVSPKMPNFAFLGQPLSRRHWE